MKNNQTIIGGVNTLKSWTQVKATGIVTNNPDVTSFNPHTINTLSGVVSLKGVKPYKAPNVHAYDKEFQTRFSGDEYRKIDQGSYWYFSETHGVTSSSCPSTTLLTEANAISNALSDFNEEVRGTLDLAVDIVQAGQVAGMLRGVGDLVHYVRHFPGHAVRSLYDLRTTSRRASSAWLQWQYGWKPLAQDIYECAQRVVQPFRTGIPVRGRGRQSESFSEEFESGGGLRTTVSGRRSVRAQYKCNVRINTGPLTILSQLSSCNPASIAWELTPYSFVVDWVVDIGGYIRNLESALINRSAFVSGCLSVGHKVNLKAVRKVSPLTVISPGAYFVHNTSAEYVRTKFQRTVLASYPVPDFPRFNAELGSGRLLNAAALLAQHLKP